MIDFAKLADEKGIAREYTDVTNNRVTISESSRKTALELMGYPLDDEEALKKCLKDEQRKSFSDLLEPVTVINDDDFPFIYIKVRADVRDNAAITCTIELEDGKTMTEVCPLYEIEIADYVVFDGVEYDIRRFILQEPLPYGYHSFSCVVTDGYNIYNSIKSSLIRTPKKAYVPQEIGNGRKIWGVSVQLYALRSRNNWGIGDFADLRKLLGFISSCGGHFVGLNPLHAGYPSNPDPDAVSPYSPSSRQWLNIIYICVEDVPEYVQCPQALALVSSKSFQQRLRALKDREYVDYRGVLELKLKVLRLIYDHQRVDDRRSIRGRQFLDFMASGGQSLLEMATYDALQASLYAQGINAWGWQVFPQEYQNSAKPFVEVWRQEHIDDVRFFCYLQFLAQEQLDNAYRKSAELKMIIGPYRDLAVGVSRGSCDVWSDKYNIYRVDGSLGAPPDPLGPLGQSWGLSPMDPVSLRRAAYRPLIDLYRANMRSCGALRIDHAAGLYRFWWVREGQDATTGAYVMSNMHDLMGILALESQRNRCLIIAEDLGTSPEELRRALKELGAYSYKLFFGERAADGGFIAPQDYEPLAMAAITTHDMPTLKGWWNNKDLETGEKLGLYTHEQADYLRRDRENSKQRILDSMHGLGSVGNEIPSTATECVMNENLVKGFQIHMCKSSCALYSSQLEDWIGVETPVNIPGTFHEYPNWRRKLTQDLEDIFSDEYVKSLTQSMTNARN